MNCVSIFKSINSLVVVFLLSVREAAPPLESAFDGVDDAVVFLGNNAFDKLSEVLRIVVVIFDVVLELGDAVVDLDEGGDDGLDVEVLLAVVVALVRSESVVLGDDVVDDLTKVVLGLELGNDGGWDVVVGGQVVGDVRDVIVNLNQMNTVD